MKKQFFLCSLLIFNSLTGLIAMQSEDVLSSKSYIIGVDLHDTYLERDLPAFFKKVSQIVYNAPNKLALLSKGPQIAMRGWQLSKLPDYAGAGHDIIEQLAKEFPDFASIKDQILDAIDGQLHKPNPKMVALMHDLKAKGFPVIIVSNISKHGLEGMKAKNPNAFSFFDAEFISDQPRKVKVGNEEIMVPKKPALKYYQILREKLLDKDDRFKGKPMIFIDDRQDYVQGAMDANVNIQGILYKNPEQVRQELISKKILENSQEPSVVPTLYQRLTGCLQSLFA